MGKLELVDEMIAFRKIQMTKIKAHLLVPCIHNFDILTSCVKVFGFLDKIMEKRCPFGIVWQNVNTK